MSNTTPPRPLSPHLQIWRWHVTMLSSILHRVTGSASVAGIVLIAAWLICLALGRETYTVFLQYAASPLGLLVWFGLSLAGFVHLTGGLRHLIWDLGLSFKPKDADTLATWTMLLGVALTIAFWAVLFTSGKVAL
ncbi:MULTISPECIES: succinate dehydrogenase, cytochrome b556 subunit [Asticcacaulis]|uniref:succinate dehydrogenase, cytochrome b556 subunit n=1 Tax=Asticcacaulis TaxID=76890 RepID=UPI001AE2C926|nr:MULTISPECIES: succinate dehydrogenase, cytochrome b556 subunit [Asticcacaulis]MBP2160101.1 succinate dehydrogenase / fumarate reductase cytochrome b subunit [Asticcacaulis solisilvae]MDR6801146.1 succinate dehydrogenase / fumarate reductase cytochrome b subunit [Asticcacaulis sp. BE141]